LNISLSWVAANVQFVPGAEGDVDMSELCATLYDAGYDYMLDPDHAPSHPQDLDLSPKKSEGHPEAVSGPYGEGGSHRMTQGFAFQFGFVIATIIAVKQSRGVGWKGARTVPPEPQRHGMAKI
jgi:hypothetical protein